MLTLDLSLEEIGCIAASIQLCVHIKAIHQTSTINLANSVLRRIHDAKVRYVKETMP